MSNGPTEVAQGGAPHRADGVAKLALGALGVVYGDIGTSPLYAVKECFARDHGVAPTPQNVLGVLSLIVWSLVLVIVVKYLTFIMRADNRGEGGILALLALVTERGEAGQGRTRGALVAFFRSHGLHAFLLLGSVVLCVTGGEALYADMGHFGATPIRRAWYAVVLPALLCNYLGQGALLLERGGDPAARANPFFALVPGATVLPMVVIATFATVVASQALISGAYSLTQQAVQLGYCPRVTIVHTSGSAEGQVYVPEVNRLLMVACVALVVTFRESSALAAAYGIAVTGTMSITSILFFQLTRRWGWATWKSASLVGLFLVFDLGFLAANAVKLRQRGWFPVAVAALGFAVMTTWKRGRASLGRHIIANTLPMPLFLDDVRATRPHRVDGTAVFMTSNPDGAPPVLLHHFKHSKVLHARVVMLSVQTLHVPEVPRGERLTSRELGEGFWQVTAAYGFMQTPDVLEALRDARGGGVPIDVDRASFYLGRETLLTTGRAGMAPWRKALFAFLSRNARPANAFSQIPPNRVVELGTQIEL